MVTATHTAAPVGGVLATLFPTICPVCNAPGDAPCTDCRAAMQPPPALPPPPGLIDCAAVLAYDRSGRALIGALKYRNDRSALRWLAEELAEAAHTVGADVLTWAPTTPAHRRSRGFDQAELLARATGRAAGLPCFATLHRVPGRSQTGRTRVERLDGPVFQARPRPRRRYAGQVVGIIDDVITSGATMTAAAAALRSVATRPRRASPTPPHAIVALAAARTPQASDEA